MKLPNTLENNVIIIKPKCKLEYRLARALKEGLEQYSSVDDDIATCVEPINENILQNVINSHDSDDNDVDDGPGENCPTPSVSEALKAAEVSNLFVHSNFDDYTMKNSLKKATQEEIGIQEAKRSIKIWSNEEIADSIDMKKKKYLTRLHANQDNHLQEYKAAKNE
ncbi:hypothetical protein HHI36_017802, partial [Cryptolaemus montrouzieri]